MLISDHKILELIDSLKSNGTIESKSELYETIGILKQNVYWIKNQKNQSKQNYHFTAEQIGKLVRVYGINANWIFGVEDKMYR